MSDRPDDLEEKLDAIHEDVRAIRRSMTFPPVRHRSETYVFGMPLWDIAFAPDLEKGEKRGHARGVVAIGDIATGIVAIGGVARGVIALGGLAIGVFALGGAALGVACVGGVSVGLLVALGGVALGGIALGGMAVGGFAHGGCAVGVIADGGLAIGYYARGGVALGKYVISPLRKDPEAVQFFNQWVPNLGRLLF